MASGISIISYGSLSPGTPAASPAVTVAAPQTPVPPVPPAAAVVPVGQGGNRPPPTGDTLPAQAAAAEPQLIQLAAAVEGINRFLRDSQRQMVFQVDLNGSHETLTIINPATGEIIRQIPASQVLTAAANLQQAGILMPGLFIDEQA